MKLEQAIKSNSFSDEKHRATVNLIYTAYWLRDSISAALKELELTPEQHNVLRILKGSHPAQMCVKEIGLRTVEKSSNVPRIIDRLVAKELVKRAQSKDDKRETLVSLTGKGIITVDIARKQVDSITKEIVNLTPDEALTLNNLLEKMRESAAE